MSVTRNSRHLTGSACVFDLNRGAVLLIEHKASGWHQLPGGHVDEDETAAEACLREVYEETGVTAELWQPHTYDIPGAVWHPTPFMVCEFWAPPKPHKGEPEHAHIDELFIAVADSTAPLTAQLAEVGCAVWVEVDELNAHNVRPDVPVVVPLAWAAASGAR
jgi:8-oxo-dGTP pyrophosphatase MutT (NUDIX family)